MSTRERWMVYPLLFLTLGIVLKDKLTKWRPRVDANVVVCRALVITDDNQRQRVVVKTTPAGGLIETLGNDHRGNVLLGYSENRFGLMFTDENDRFISGLQPNLLLPSPAPRSLVPSAAPNSRPRTGAPPAEPPNPDTSAEEPPEK